MANIRKMAATGKLIVAGPFEDNGDLRGVFIFQGVTVEEAKSMTDGMTVPMIRISSGCDHLIVARKCMYLIEVHLNRKL